MINYFYYFSSLLMYYVSASTFSNEIMQHGNWRYIPLRKCGITEGRNRIIDGKNAHRVQFPWIAQLYLTEGIEQRFICGGTLISERYVVTAAHCVYEMIDRVQYIILGNSRLKYDYRQRSKCTRRKPEFLKIENITIYPEYSGTQSFFHDLALIRVEKPVKYSAVIRPICLPMHDVLDEEFVAEKVNVAGWGMVASGVYPTNLQYATIPMRDRCVCNSVYDEQLHEGQFCAGVYGKDTCFGDSGGPVMWIRKEQFIHKHYLIGVVSYGNSKCGSSPGVYTNVTHYVTWILDTIYG